MQYFKDRQMDRLQTPKRTYKKELSKGQSHLKGLAEKEFHPATPALQGQRLATTSKAYSLKRRNKIITIIYPCNLMPSLKAMNSNFSDENM